MDKMNKVTPVLVDDPIYKNVVIEEEESERSTSCKVITLRILMCILLSGVCAGLGSASYLILRQSETNTFNRQYGIVKRILIREEL